jgi:lipoprotein-releasing system permease protein
LVELNDFPYLSVTFASIFLIFGLLTLVGRKYLSFLTLRYLRNRFLSYVSICIIAFSVIFLVIAPSVMNGFSAEFRAKVRGTLSDLMVWGPTPFSFPAPESYDSFKDPVERQKVQQQLLNEIYSEMKNVTGVAEISPYIDNPALFKHRKTIDYCFLRGADPELEAKVSQFGSYILALRKIYKIVNEDELRNAGTDEMEFHNQMMSELPEKQDLKETFGYMKNGYQPLHPITGERMEKKYPGVLVGIYFLKHYNLRIGQLIELTTASDSNEVSENNKFAIVGAFQSGFYEPDRRKIYMSLEAAQKFVAIEKRISGISIKCKDGHKAEAVRANIGEFVYHLIESGKFPRRSPARTWEEKDANLLKAVKMEKLMIRMITSMIVLSAMGTIFVILLMSVREKARDLGILKALGGTTFGILRIYVGQGVILTVLGVALGIGLGMFLSLYLNEVADTLHRLTGFHPFPPDVYYLDQIPVLIDLGEVMQIVGITILAAIVMAVIPGLWAACLDPMEAVRYE